MTRKRDIAMYAVALVLAFIVGTLVGEDCATPSPPEEQGVDLAPVCDPVREVVYECPPDAGTPVDVEPSGEAAPSVRPKRRDLPAAEPPTTPRQRARLLAWVRDQSVDLDGCRSANKDTYRLSVTLGLRDGEVAAVRLNASASELPSNVASCLRQRMSTWNPPPDLIEGRRELVFGLTL
jgi:hypothetical protein